MVGWSDEQKLIKPKAFVVLKSPEKANDALVLALQDHVKQKLAPYKYPRWIEFRKDLPKTATENPAVQIAGRGEIKTVMPREGGASSE